MMYKVYFENRAIIFFDHDEENIHKNEQFIFCKSKKSFDNAYNLFLNDLSIDKLFVKCDDSKLFFKHLKSKFKKIAAAGGLVINPANEYLCIKRNNIWDLPKGKIEKQETKREAARREVQEECGISGLKVLSKILKTYHTYQFNGQNVFKTTHWYRMFYKGNQPVMPQIEEGITEVKWVPKIQMEEQMENTYESLKPVFLIAKSI